MKNKLLPLSVHLFLILAVCIGGFFVFLRCAEFSEEAGFMYYNDRFKVPFFEEDDCFVNEKVPIFSKSDVTSPIVGYLEPGAEFRGTSSYPWVELTDNRGYVCYTPFSDKNRANFYQMRTPLGLFQARFEFGGYVTFFVVLLVLMSISIFGKILFDIYGYKLDSDWKKWVTEIRAGIYLIVGAALIYYVFEDINGRGMAKPDFYEGQIPSIWWMSFYYMKGWALLTIPVCSSILFAYALWTLNIWGDYKNICLKHLKEESSFGVIANGLFTIVFYPVTLIAGVIEAIMGIIGLLIVGFFLSAPKATAQTLVDNAEGKLRDAELSDKDGHKKDVTRIGQDLYTDFEGNIYKKKWGLDEVEKI